MLDFYKNKQDKLNIIQLSQLLAFLASLPGTLAAFFLGDFFCLLWFLLDSALNVMHSYIVQKMDEQFTVV